MRTKMFIALQALGIALAGCGGGASPVLPSTSHQGLMNELPGNKGFFEIRAKGNGADRGGARAKKAAQNTIVVHFYGPDGTTELSPAPSDVTVKIGGDTGTVVSLAPQSSGGFASTAGLYPSAFRGRLNAKIGGEPIEANFMIR